jgi:hypothetical protein
VAEKLVACQDGLNSLDLVISSACETLHGERPWHVADRRSHHESSDNVDRLHYWNESVSVTYEGIVVVELSAA